MRNLPAAWLVKVPLMAIPARLNYFIISSSVGFIASAQIR